ncbi:MAG: hemolysin family protein [bacterium]
MLTEILILILLLTLSGFFSMSETAITTVSRVKVRRMVDQKIRHARILLKLREEPGKFLSTVLVGNNLVNIAASVLATSIVIKVFQDMGFKGEATALGVATGVMTLLILVFGEITPKTIAMHNAERIALVVAPMVQIISILFHPLVVVLTFIVKPLLFIFGYQVSPQGPFVSEEEIRILLSMGEKEGVIEEEERRMISSIFDFGDTVVREVMTPKPDMVFLDVEDAIEKAFITISETGHSRIPICEGNMDNIVGIIYAKDLLVIPHEKKMDGLRGLLRPVIFVPESKKLDDLMRQMQSSHTHLAIVLDEYGATTGLVSFEDLMEEIVGEIRDEFDQEEKKVEKLDRNTYMIDASLSVKELNQKIKLAIPEGAYDTIGGFVLSKLGKVPNVGDVIHFDDVIIHVEKVSKRRITRVRLIKPEDVNDVAGG